MSFSTSFFSFERFSDVACTSPVLLLLTTSYPDAVTAAHPDGRHFIMIQPVAGKRTLAELHVVVNWSDELKARLAVARN